MTIALHPRFNTGLIAYLTQRHCTSRPLPPLARWRLNALPHISQEGLAYISLYANRRAHCIAPSASQSHTTSPTSPHLCRKDKDLLTRCACITSMECSNIVQSICMDIILGKAIALCVHANTQIQSPHARQLLASPSSLTSPYDAVAYCRSPPPCGPQGDPLGRPAPGPWQVRPQMGSLRPTLLPRPSLACLGRLPGGGAAGDQNHRQLWVDPAGVAAAESGLVARVAGVDAASALARGLLVGVHELAPPSVHEKPA